MNKSDCIPKNPYAIKTRQLSYWAKFPHKSFQLEVIDTLIGHFVSEALAIPLKGTSIYQVLKYNKNYSKFA